MKISNINCVFFAKYGNCAPLDRRKGFLGSARSYILISEHFAADFMKMVEHALQKGPHPPPPPSTHPENDGSRVEIP